MWNMAKLTRARPMVMFTSLVGARNSSIRPTNGSRPLQLLSRMK